MNRFLFSRLTFCLLVLLPASIFADFEAEPTVSRYQLQNPSNRVMDQISEHFEIVRRHVVGAEVSYEVNILLRDAEKLKQLAPDAKLLVKNIRQELAKEIDSFVDEPQAEFRYRSLAEVEAYLVNLKNRYPDIVKLVPYGWSRMGKELFAVKISDNVLVDEDEPELMITAATHGDEIITVDQTLKKALD